MHKYDPIINKTSEPLNSINKLIVSDPDSTYLKFAKIYFSYYESDYETANKLVETIDNKTSDTYLLTSLGLYQLGVDWNLAAQFFRNAIEVDEDNINFWAYLFLARVLIHNQDTTKSILKTFEMGMDIYKSNFLLVEYCSYVIDENRYFDALPYVKMIEDNFDPIIKNNLLGHCYIGIGGRDNREIGEKYFIKTLTIQPSNEIAIYSLNTMYCIYEEYNKISKILMNYLQHVTSEYTTDVLIDSTRSLKNVFQFEACILYLKKALEYRYDDLMLLELVHAYLLLNRNQDAKTVYEKYTGAERTEEVEFEKAKLLITYIFYKMNYELEETKFLEKYEEFEYYNYIIYFQQLVPEEE